MKTLKDVACGQTVQVKRLTGEGPVKRRIMDMGITKGVDILVRKAGRRRAGEEKNHGYGHHKGGRSLCEKGGAFRRSGGNYGKRI